MSRINTFTVAGAVGFVDGVDFTTTSSGLIEKVESFFVPAGTFKQNDVINIQALVTRYLTTGSQFSSYVYWNQTDDLDTPILIAQSRTLSVNDDYLPLYRSVSIIDSTTTLVWSTSQLTPTDLGDTSGQETDVAMSTITTIDWNTDGYIILACEARNITKRYFVIIK